MNPRPSSSTPAASAKAPTQPVFHTDGPLALFGGAPAFDDPQHVGRPNLGDRERFMERVGDILDRRWLTNNGPYVQAFERRVAEISGTRHCVAVCNGTVALEIMARATGMRGQVIVPSFTFVATAHALQWQEIQPVFCDVDPDTWCLDPERVEQLITPRTTGIVGVHLWGRPCDVEGLQAVADRHDLVLGYDAAHVFGCEFYGKPVGAFGKAAVFSFHATKVCNALEGGAIVTDDDELAERMRLMRNFGFEGRDNVVHIGSNGKLNEMSAAMGLTSIESMERFVEHNRQVYQAYAESLGGLPGLRVMEFDPRHRTNFHNVIVEVDGAIAGLDRDQLVRALEAENVLARRYFAPGTHAMEPYRSDQPLSEFVLPVTQHLCGRVLSLPTGEALSVEGARRIGDLVRAYLARAGEVPAALEQRDRRLAQRDA